MNKLKFTVLIILLQVVTTVLGQDMTIEQTLDYINSKFSKLKPQFLYNTITHKNNETKYGIELDKAGDLTIIENVRCYKWDNGVKYDEYTYVVRNEFSATDVSIEFVGITDKASIQIKCKQFASKSKCIIVSNSERTFDDSFIFMTIDDHNIAESISNALKHLINKIRNDSIYTNKKTNEADPFAPKSNPPKSPTPSTYTSGNRKNVVTMIKSADGTYEIPVQINGVLKIKFVFDSGASDVSISPDVALTLMKTGTVTKSDFIGTQRYQFADGTTAESKVFIIKELQIGNKKVTNVRASISNSVEAPMLLGQSVLQKFGKFTIDNNVHTITIE